MSFRQISKFLAVFGFAATACACAGQSYTPRARADRRPVPREARRSVEPTAPGPGGGLEDGSPREDPPMPPPLEHVHRRPISPTEARLSSGVRVLMLERHDFPAASVAFVLDRGDAAGPAGVARLFAHLLSGSNKRESARELHEYLAFVGATLDTWSTPDAVVARVTALAPLLPGAVEHVSAAATTPAWTGEDFASARSEVAGELAGDREDADAIAHAALMEVLVGAEHPYAKAAEPPSDARIRGMSKLEVENFRDMFVVPQRMSVVAVGDFAPARLVAQLEELFRALPKKPSLPSASGPPKLAPMKPRVTLVDRGGAGQAHVRIGFRGAKRGDAANAPLALLGSLLGRSLSGRLDLKIRGKHGLSYGVRARNLALRDAGTFEISCAVETARTKEAIRGLLSELDRLTKEPVDDGELARARAHVLGGEEDVTFGALLGVAANGLPLGAPEALDAAIAKLTPEDIRAAAAEMLRAELAQIVVVGDAASLRPELATLGAGDVVTR